MSRSATPASRAGAALVLAVLLCGLWAVPAAAQGPAPPEVGASGAVLWDPADDAVLHGVAERVARPMASTTKIMTVLLALEAGTAADVVTVSSGAARAGGASLDLAAGQEVPMESLLAGLLLRSGNDAAIAVAEHVAGSEEAFVERMNARARELGLEATRFVNASGLTDDPGHHATPLDLARLAEVAMRDPRFARHAGAAEATVSRLPPMTSRNELLGRYPGATGVKTGFTTLAGNCLVASATRDGRTLYAVALGSDDSFADAAALLDHGFDDYRRVAPLAAGVTATRYRWAGAEVALAAPEPLAATVPVAADVSWRTVLEASADRPVPDGERLGVAELVVDGRAARSVPLLATGAVTAAGPAAPAAQVGAAVQEALRVFVRLHTLDRMITR